MNKVIRVTLLLVLMALSYVAVDVNGIDANDTCQPTNLAGEHADGDVLLTWDAPTDCSPTGYTVLRRSKSEDGDWEAPLAPIATGVTGTSYTDSSPTQDRIHRYRVEGEGVDGIWSRWVNVTVPVAPPPPPPECRPANLAGEHVDVDVLLTWDAPTDCSPTGYTVLRRSKPEDGRWEGALASIATGVTGTSYTDSSPTQDRIHRYRVEGEGVDGKRSLFIDVTVPVDTSTEQKSALRQAPSPHVVPDDWVLIPSGLNPGDSFRLIFLSSTTRVLSSTDIADYNTFVQDRAAAGHAAIQEYSSDFRVVGSTESIDARDNTATTHTNSDKGVPIYWLNGAKVADDYESFYDGGWDDEANDKNQLGNNGPDTSQQVNFPATGSVHDGTESNPGSNSQALGASFVRVGRPHSSDDSAHGPLSSNTSVGSAAERPLYGLSPVFIVEDTSVAARVVSDDWALKPSNMGPGDSFRLIFISSTKRDLVPGQSRNCMDRGDGVWSGRPGC